MKCGVEKKKRKKKKEAVVSWPANDSHGIFDTSLEIIQSFATYFNYIQLNCREADWKKHPWSRKRRKHALETNKSGRNGFDFVLNCGEKKK